MQKVVRAVVVPGFLALFLAQLAAPSPALCEEHYRMISPTDRSTEVSLDLHNTEIQSALKLLAEVKNANIAFQRDVNGKIRSFQVSGVPASQVFNILLRMNSLYAEEEGNVVIVYPIEQYIRDAKARKALEES